MIQLPDLRRCVYAAGDVANAYRSVSPSRVWVELLPCWGKSSGWQHRLPAWVAA